MMGKKTGENARTNTERSRQRQALVSAIAERVGTDDTCVVANYSELGRSVGIKDVNSYYDYSWLAGKRYIRRDGNIVTLTEQGREFIARYDSDEEEPDISVAVIGPSIKVAADVAPTSIALSTAGKQDAASAFSEVMTAPISDPTNLTWLRERAAGGGARLDYLRSILAQALQNSIAAMADEEAALLNELAELGIELPAKIGPLPSAPAPSAAATHVVIIPTSILPPATPAIGVSEAAANEAGNQVADVSADKIASDAPSQPILPTHNAAATAVVIATNTNGSADEYTVIVASNGAENDGAYRLTSREMGHIAAGYSDDPEQQRAAAASGGGCCRAYLSEKCSNPPVAGYAGCDRHLTGAEGLQYKTGTYAGADAAADFARIAEGAAKLTAKDINALADHHLRRDTRLEMVVRKVPDLYRQLYCTAWRELSSASEVMVVDIASS